MLHVLFAFVLAQSAAQDAPQIARDNYGVPHISASGLDDAFFQAGYAVAEDRLWQMENSRRLARGKMSEVFGSRFLPSDREILKTGYSEQQLTQQLQLLGSEGQAAFAAYARGVNAYIATAKQAGKLPKGYADNGFQPEPWTPTDSAAICIRLFQQFGRFGAGEIRGLAMSIYMQGQPCKAKYLDVLDDFMWQNDPGAPTTIAAGEGGNARPALASFTRQDTERQLAAMPKVSLFELLPGFRLESRESSMLAAEERGVPFKMGSYAVAVDKSRSASGNALLLSAPQMGFTDPSIVHEMSISTPQFSVAGMDVPGVPGVVIGYTPNVAWGLTSGVADTDDLVVLNRPDTDKYLYGGTPMPIQKIERELKVKGGSAETVIQEMSHLGPVILDSRGTKTAFVRQSAAWMKELKSLDAVFGVYRAKSSADMNTALAHATVNFNCLFAFSSGDIGYRYVGLVPIRAAGIDPRFPTPGDPKYDWKGMVPFSQMPHVDNPKSGLLYNWNNKPADWWPNLDTPVWGRIFRVWELAGALNKPKLGREDVEMAAWTIARRHSDEKLLLPFIKNALKGAIFDGVNAQTAAQLMNWDGWALQDSVGATIFTNLIAALRVELFAPHVGTMIQPDLFAQAIQPSLILNALEGKTKYSFLGGRKASEVVVAALKRTSESLINARGEAVAAWGYKPATIVYSGEPEVPYRERGTYIQIIEMATTPYGRNVLPPGVAETGPHSRDQIPLSRAWTFKPMKLKS
ncbi:MAG: penicillin acylase family protein [Fimbriimonadaceae bacterium]|nr:penicillin acylase family protein [Fimbriimonadaceae bacterium]